MSEIPLKNQIIAWLRQQSYWLQASGNKLIEGEALTKELLNEAYSFFKEDHDLIPKGSDQVSVEFKEIQHTNFQGSASLNLQAIKNIENVNALAAGQSIPIGSNLTVIYGGNGTGKSGYVRLLNNSFTSRGDKQILHNVFGVKNGDPNCTFTFKTEKGSYDLTYPKDKANTEFSQYCVFDSHSIRVHLESDNKLNFTPLGFEFFEKTVEMFESLKSSLQEELESNRPTNSFIPLFENDNAIRTIITELSSKSNFDEIKKVTTYTDEDAAKYADLIAKKENLKALDIPKKISELQLIKDQLNTFIVRQRIIQDSLTEAEIAEAKNLIVSYSKFLELVKEEGIKSLEQYKINEVGSAEWKEFLVATRKYAALIEKNRNNLPFPSGSDNCVFCLQPLGQNEQSLIQSYWKLLKSEAEGELHRIIEKIRATEKRLSGLSPAKFDETTKIYEYLSPKAAEFCKNWKEKVSASATALSNLTTNLSKKNYELKTDAFPTLTSEFDKYIEQIDKDIDALFKRNPEKEIQELEKEIAYLADKNTISKLFSQIEVFINAHKWADRAEKAMSKLNTKSITVIQGQLFNEHITEKYTLLFNAECEKLNAPTVVQINQKNSKVATLRKLQIEGVSANSVLSEGEQRAISLADFLTEVQLNPLNKGIFFDDPVTSQDHQRREAIADRLVDLAKENKQVIVFTHDVAFFIRLKNLAEFMGVPTAISTIRNVGGIPGTINENLPWIAQNVKGRLGILRDRLVRLTKIESENSDEYLFALKAWYELLREGWERAVEERLFKGVVERFNVGVQTQKLKNVIVTKELVEEIEAGMTQSSKWIHDTAAGLNPQIPDSKRAEIDLKAFEAFATKCVTA